MELGHVADMVIPAPQAKATCSGIKTVVYVLVENGGCGEDLTWERHD